jgi:hypothetical protein
MSPLIVGFTSAVADADADADADVEDGGKPAAGAGTRSMTSCMRCRAPVQASHVSVQASHVSEAVIVPHVTGSPLQLSESNTKCYNFEMSERALLVHVAQTTDIEPCVAAEKTVHSQHKTRHDSLGADTLYMRKEVRPPAVRAPVATRLLQRV